MTDAYLAHENGAMILKRNTHIAMYTGSEESARLDCLCYLLQTVQRPPQLADARRYTTIDGRFSMLHGAIESPTIAYETWGELSAAGDNAVLLFTGLSPSAHAASSPDDPSSGWWEDMVGADKPIDTSRYFVICVNSLGSCFGSTGPATANPTTGETYRLDFPVLALEDVAHAGHAVVPVP